MTFNQSNRAIVVVDMQDFFLRKFLPNVLSDLVSNQNKVLSLGRKYKLPLIILEYKCRGVYRGATTKKLQVGAGAKEIIIKESNGGFTNTNLDSILKSLKAKEIILIGINANACVQDTAIGALHRGYKVVTAGGVIASVSRKDSILSNKNKKWFMDNTKFFEKPEDLEAYLSK